MAAKISYIPLGIQKEDDIYIDPTNVSRSIYVTGFRATTKSEDLIIHFQKKKNGGSDIDSIIISKRGAAAITFDNPEGKIFMADWLLRCYMRCRERIDLICLAHVPLKTYYRVCRSSYSMKESHHIQNY